MSGPDINLEEALREIAILEKQLKDRLKKKKEETTYPSPPSPIIVTKSNPRPKFSCPKLKKVEVSDFSLPPDILDFVREEGSSFLSILSRLKSLPQTDFELPNDYFLLENEEDRILSPSLLSSKRKRRRTLSPTLSQDSSQSKRPRIPLTELIPQENHDLVRNFELRKNALVLTDGDGNVLSESPRVEEGSDLIVISHGRGKVGALVPFLAQTGASTSVCLASYAWHDNDSMMWSTQIRLLIKEHRVIKSLLAHREESTGTLFLFYYIPSLFITRIHSFHPEKDSYESTLSHMQFSSVKAKVNQCGLGVTKQSNRVLWARCTDAVTFLWNVQNGGLIKRIQKAEMNLS